MKKVVLVICDGLGDRPIKALKNKTPLESAKTPNLNKLAKKGITGLMDTIGVGIRPGSDTAHLSIFGYAPAIYYSGRGPFEAAGIGLKLKKGDVAFRANFGTVDKNFFVKDRRAGRISSGEELARALNGIKIQGIEFLVKPSLEHRAVLIMQGKGLSSNVSDVDPHITGVKVLKAKALDKSKEAKFTANVLNKFLLKAHKILKSHSFNEIRKKKGLLPANYLLVRGAGTVKKIPSFKEKYGLKACCVAGANLYKGIARTLGMEVIKVKGATGSKNTDVSAKFKAAKNALKKFDFVFVHVKGTDLFAEDGNALGKKKFIEKIDKALKVLMNLKDSLLIVTADHSTPCSLKAHSGDPVPILIYGSGIRSDSVKEFGEKSCANGGMQRILGLELMPEILNLLGKAKLFGG